MNGLSTLARGSWTTSVAPAFFFFFCFFFFFLAPVSSPRPLSLKRAQKREGENRSFVVQQQVENKPCPNVLCTAELKYTLYNCC